MKTFPFSIAAEDLTGPWVLKDQSFTKELERVPEATPVSSGEPRNIGQALALTLATAVAVALTAAGEPPAGSSDVRVVAKMASNFDFILLVPFASFFRRGETTFIRSG